MYKATINILVIIAIIAIGILSTVLYAQDPCPPEDPFKNPPSNCDYNYDDGQTTLVCD